jgi:hypothetical protein
MKRAALLIVLLTCAAWAQTPDTPSRVRSLLGNSQAQPPASQAVAPSSQSAALAPAAASPLKSKAGASNKLAASKPAQPEPKIVEATPGEALPLQKPAGKRDPFLSPVVERAAGPSKCNTGKRCLVIDQMVLRGVVRTANGMIAVVSNTSNKAYFLKENDPVFNGVVVKITGDSVVFKEHTVDNIGRAGTREVVKRVSPAPAV